MELGEFLKRYRGTHFHLGTYDCLVFVLDWLEARHGHIGRDAILAKVPYQSMRDVRLRYPTVHEWADLLVAHLGPAATDVPCPGDVALLLQEQRPMLGIVGTQLIYVPGEQGVAALSMHHLINYWRPRLWSMPS